MPAFARGKIVEADAVGIYHCINRCVRRAFLCGCDALSGRSFEHRREWIQRRLETLAGLFAVEVLGFAVMANHWHVVLRIRPDLVSAWDDETVALRWWRLFPRRRDADGQPAVPEPHELRALVADPLLLAERRQRLASLSWFMRALSEPIARRANREDGCTGRFWEGRFKSQPLLDEAAVLACSIYVDLNPLRAGLAATPETSAFTGAYERIAAQQTAEREAAAAQIESAAEPVAVAGNPRDGWLAPIALAARKPGLDGEAASAEQTSSRPNGSPARPLPRRASDRGFLPLVLDEYLQLLDWTGRQLRHDQSAAIPAGLAPILERLHVSTVHWCETVAKFGRWFRQAAGSAASLRRFAERRGHHWMHGIGRSRLAFDQ